LTEFEGAPAGTPVVHATEDGHALQPSLFGGPSPVEKEVAALDIDGMTPIEAIQRLYELRALARDGHAP
jgi:hypothetical protein